MKEIDARGLSCPAPVLKTKAVLEAEPLTGVTVVVDNPAARENVLRFLGSQGFTTNSAQQGEDYRITGTRPSATVAALSPEKHREHGKIMVLCATDRLGFGDDTLGQKLMVNFIRTLKEMGDDLWRVVFVNNGVKLTVDGSAVLDDLKAYESAGLKIMVCGTCLDHFSLLDRKQVGETTNMLDIVTAMQLADKVISL
ncbi:MAG: sulfurtransferase-like selenium metabolism protein YedF [Thermodesulfobacteriota bacterium]